MLCLITYSKAFVVELGGSEGSNNKMPRTCYSLYLILLLQSMIKFGKGNNKDLNMLLKILMEESLFLVVSLKHSDCK